MKPVGKLPATVGESGVGQRIPGCVPDQKHVTNLGCRCLSGWRTWNTQSDTGLQVTCRRSQRFSPLCSPCTTGWETRPESVDYSGLMTV